MSRTEDLDDDEYIAKLLADDARTSSVKYASLGMSALLPERYDSCWGLLSAVNDNG